MITGSASANGAGFEPVFETVLEQATQPFGNQTAPDLGVIFVTTEFEDKLGDAAAAIQSRTGAKCLIGCTAEGVIGPEREHERVPAVSLWLGHLPGASVQPIRATQDEIAGAITGEDWSSLLRTTHGETGNVILIGDPFSVDVEMLLTKVNEQSPEISITGGMCSGGYGPGTSMLALNGEIHRDGAVGVSIRGGVTVDTVVSQGCRPVGRPLLITAGEKNIIQELAGRPPVDVINEMFADVDDEERALVRNGLFVGRVIDEYKERFERGDFLIRNIMGVDRENGYIAVMDRVRPGGTIQFHVRDAATAAEDLQHMLAPHRNGSAPGVLLFSCNGRGTRLFDEPGHDVNVIRRNLDSPSIAGFFCAGELGPVSGKNFIHGHTASMAIIRPALA